MAVIDEAWKHAPDLGAELLQAAVPTQTTRQRRQLWLVSTAGPPEAVWMRQWIERGRNGEEGLAFFEWAGTSVEEADAPETWPGMHPAFGELITMADLVEFRRSMGREGFARAYLNIWPDLPPPVQEVSAPLTFETWAACEDDTAQLDGRVVFAADADPVSHVAAVAAAGKGPRGHHVELVQVEPGTVWLPDRLSELAARHQGSVVADEGGPIGWVAEELARRGVPYTPIRPATYARGCAQLSDAARAGQLTHPASGALDAAVQGAARRSMGGGWCWDRKRSSTDIAPLVAATLAYVGAVADLGADQAAIY